MVTDEMLDAIDMMIEICTSEEQKKGMRSVAAMLDEFDQCGWLATDNPSDCYEWLVQFMNTEEKKGAMK